MEGVSGLQRERHLNSLLEKRAPWPCAKWLVKGSANTKVEGEVLCNLGIILSGESLPQGEGGEPVSELLFYSQFEVLRCHLRRNWKSAELWATLPPVCLLCDCTTLGPLGCHGNSFRLGELYSQYGQGVPLGKKQMLLVLSFVKVRTLAWLHDHLSTFLPNPVVCDRFLLSLVKREDG